MSYASELAGSQGELGLFVTIGGGNVFTSTNGTTWTKTAYSAFVYLSILMGIVWSGTKFVAFVLGSVHTSTNGTTWTQTYENNTVSFRHICFSPELNLFVAVASGGSNNLLFASSTDAVTWTFTTPYPTSIVVYVTAIVWAAELGVFVALNNQRIRGALISKDGINWQEGYYKFSAADSFTSVCWSPQQAKFVAVGSGAYICNVVKTVVGVNTSVTPSGQLGVRTTTVRENKALDVAGDAIVTGSIMAKQIYLNADKSPVAGINCPIDPENLYTWWGEFSYNVGAEPLNGRLVAVGGATLGTPFYWNRQNMFYINGNQDTGLAGPENIALITYISASLPVKPGVSHSLFLRLISYDRWSTCTPYVIGANGLPWYRLHARTNSYQNTTYPNTSWIGPDGESSASHVYHEWQMFSIPQYIIDSHSYTDATDTKSKYKRNIKIAIISGRNNTDGGALYLSGIAMRPNPYGLTFHGALDVHWATNGGTGTNWYSTNWNNENLNQFDGGTNYNNIRIPICPPKDPAKSAFPDFYLVVISHNLTYLTEKYPYIFLQNPTNSADIQPLGRFSPHIVGRYGAGLREPNKYAMGLIVPSVNPRYVVYVAGRPYLNIRYDNSQFGHGGASHVRGFFTEVVGDDVAEYDRYVPYAIGSARYYSDPVDWNEILTNYSVAQLAGA